MREHTSGHTDVSWLPSCRAIGDNWEDLKEQLKYGTDHRQATITSLETQALQPLKRTVLGELEGNFKKVR